MHVASKFCPNSDVSFLDTQGVPFYNVCPTYILLRCNIHILTIIIFGIEKKLENFLILPNKKYKKIDIILQWRT